MSLNLSTSVTFYGSFTAAQLTEFISQVPAHAKISVTKYNGDMREGSSTTFNATWVSGNHLENRR